MRQPPFRPRSQFTDAAREYRDQQPIAPPRNGNGADIDIFDDAPSPIEVEEPAHIRDEQEAIGVAEPARNGCPSTSVTLVRASDLTPKPVRWLWPGWLARGKMHIIGGQPGAGKTTLAMAKAAIVSRGGRWPDGSHSPLGDIVIWSGEDDPEDTLVPRLKTSGADMTRIHFVGDTMEGNKRRPFDPAKDCRRFPLKSKRSVGRLL